MNVFMTGGSGDLGTVLSKALAARGDVPYRMDIKEPADAVGVFYQASLLDREKLATLLTDIDVIVHIAAWHGIHEVRQEKDTYDFFDLNVTGTLNIFEAAYRAGIKNIVNISSTSIDEKEGFYGRTKVLAEELADYYLTQKGLNILSLRPRAFIPHTNKAVYASFVEWAKWFWDGAVHIDDVCTAVMQSIDRVARHKFNEHLSIEIDGAYEYSDQDLLDWDKAGAGTTFKKYYSEYYDLVVRSGLDPALKPSKIDHAQARAILGYQPEYSLKNLLIELAALQVN